jgi:hypothetical protein
MVSQNFGYRRANEGAVVTLKPIVEELAGNPYRELFSFELKRHYRLEPGFIAQARNLAADPG